MNNQFIYTNTSASKSIDLSLRKFILVCFVFVTIYNPTFFSNDYINYLLPVFYYCISLFLINKNSFFKIKKLSNLLITFTFFSSFFFVLVALSNGVSFSDIYHLRIVQSFSPIFSILTLFNIEFFLSKKKAKTTDKFSILLNACVIQFLFVCLSLIFPQLRQIILEKFYFHDSRNYTFTIAKRVYGIMSDYTFGGSVFHGFMAFISLYLGAKYNKKFYFYIIPCLFIVFFNSRIGLIIFIICSFLFLLFGKIYASKKILILTGLLLTFVFAIIVLPSINSATFSFFKNGFLEIFSFLKTGNASSALIDGKTSDLDLLFNQLQADLNIRVVFFGSGMKIQNLGDIPNGLTFSGKYSDMGFLNDAYMGGIFYQFLLYYPYLKFILKKSKSNKNRFIDYMILIVLFIGNIKGEVFRSAIILGSVLYIKLVFLEEGGSNNGKSLSSNV